MFRRAAAENAVSTDLMDSVSEEGEIVEEQGDTNVATSTRSSTGQRTNGNNGSTSDQNASAATQSKTRVSKERASETATTNSSGKRGRPKKQSDDAEELFCSSVEFTVVESFFGDNRISLSQVGVTSSQVTLTRTRSDTQTSSLVGSSRLVIFNNELDSLAYNMRTPPYGIVFGVTSGCASRARTTLKVADCRTKTFVLHVSVDSCHSRVNFHDLFGSLVRRLIGSSGCKLEEIESSALLKNLDETREAAKVAEAKRELEADAAPRVSKSVRLPAAVSVAFVPETAELRNAYEKTMPAVRQQLTRSQQKVADSSSSNSSPMTVRPTTRQSGANGSKTAASQSKAREKDWEQWRFDEGDSLTFPRAGKNSWTLTNADLITLRDGEFLNDGIINFYLKYLYHRVLPARLRQRTYVFNTFFYSRLTQTTPSATSRNGLSPAKFYGTDKSRSSRSRSSSDCEVCEPEEVQECDLDKSTQSSAETMLKRHASVRNWTRNVDLFDKDFVLIPINVQSHWLIAFVCFAGSHTTDCSNANTDNKVANSRSCSPEAKRARSNTPNSKTNETNKVPVIRVVMTRGRGGKRESAAQEKLAKPETVLNRSNGDTTSCAADESFRVSESDSVKSVGELVQELKRESQRSGAVLQQLANHCDTSSLLNESTESTTVNGVHQSAENGSGAGGESTLGQPTADDGESESAQEKADQNDQEQLQPDGPIGFETESILDRNRQPCLILFDSLATSRPKYNVARDIREYLQVEWNTRKASQCGSRAFASSERNAQITTYMPILPAQTNCFDCGLYVLEYAERFFTKPIKQLVKSPKRPNLEEWFTGADIPNKREQIQKVIMELYEEEKQLRQSNGQSTNAI